MTAAERQALSDLLVRLGDGERAAFAPLFAALWPLVRAFCGRALPDADADDAAQQALTNVLARADEFDAGRDAVSWTFGIAANEIRSQRQRVRRRREAGLAAASHVADGALAPEASAERRELLAAAAELLGTLGADDLATLGAALDGDPGARGAIAPATFRKRLERALGRLRGAWRDKHGVP